MKKDNNSSKRTLAELADQLQSNRRYTFSRDEALNKLGVSPQNLKKSVMRLADKGRLAVPKRGFYVIVPTEYRKAGAPPPSWFIDDKHVQSLYFQATRSGKIPSNKTRALSLPLNRDKMAEMKMKSIRTVLLVAALVALGAIAGNRMTLDVAAQTAPPGAAQKPELVIQNGHSGSVNSVVFCPDGKMLASGGSDMTIKLWEVSTGRLIRSFAGHSAWIKSVSFDPDGKTLASGSGDKTIKLWDVATGRLIRTLAGHSDPIESVSFSPDGKILASGSWDKTIKLWEVSTGRLIRTLRGHSGWVETVSFSLDGKILVSGGDDKTIKLWDMSTGREIRTLKGHSSIIWSVSFSPDGKTLVSGSADKTIKLWDISTGKLIRTLEGHSDQVMCVSFSPDGKTLASGSGDKTIKLWELSSGRATITIKGHIWFISSVFFSPDGKSLVSGCTLSTIIKLWDVATGRMIRTLEGHSSVSKSVSFSPDGKTLASGSIYGIKLWDVASGLLVRNLVGDFYSVTSLAFSPDGKTLASTLASKNGGETTLNIWDVSTPKNTQLIRSYKTSASSVSFNPDGKTLASGGGDKTVKLWDVATGRLLRTLEGHSSVVNSIIFSPDGKTLTSGSKDKTVKLWDVATGRLLRTLEGHSSVVNSIIFSPDGKTLTSGSGDTTIKVWEANTGKLLCTLLYLDKEDWVVYTPEGLFDASSNANKYIGWTVGMKNYSFELFWDEFYQPGLFSLVISGQSLVAKKDLRQGFAVPPDVTIVSPKPGETINTDTVQVAVQATDTGGGVQDIRLYHQGKLVGQEGRGIGGVRQSGKVVTQTFNVTLVEGENTLRATAYSTDNIEAVPYEVKIRSAVKAKKPNLFMVAVGINQYKNPQYKLKYSRADAEEIIKFFTAQEGKIFEKVYAKTLFDDQATRANILDALKQPAKPEDVIIIYLAGHGIAIEGRYYYLPYELTNANDATVKQMGVPQDEIISALKNVQARKVLMFLDTCQAGALVLAMRGMEEERAVNLLAKTAGVHILSAANESQAAAESTEFQHGIFTYAIMEGLSGKADTNNDKIVKISELLGYVCSEVETIAKKYGKEQYPKMSMYGDDFPLAVRQ